MEPETITVNADGMHQWLYLLDAKDAVWHKSYPVTTHQYSRYRARTSADQEPTIRIRLSVILQPTPDADDLWGYTVAYLLEEQTTAQHAAIGYWAGVAIHRTHGAALNQMERMARKFGWNG